MDEGLGHRGQVTEQGGRGDAAGAQRDGVDPVGAGDGRRHPEGLVQARHVGVEVPLPLLHGGVAPADHVHLEPLGQRVLDQAAARCHVHEVVLVDLGRHEHHRPGVDQLGGRRVLDQLAHLVVEDHRPRGHTEVPPDGVGVGVGGAGQAVVGPDVSGEVGHARQDAAAAGLVGPDHGVGVEQQRVGGGQGRGGERGGQAGPLLGAPVERGVVDQGQRGPGPGQVGLAQPSEGRVVGPGRVLEPPVLGLGGHAGASHGDPAQFESHPGHGAGKGPRRGLRPEGDHGAGEAQRVEAAHQTAGDPRRHPYCGGDDVAHVPLQLHKTRWSKSVPEVARGPVNHSTLGRRQGF